jgi:hypothetical protein
MDANHATVKDTMAGDGPVDAVLAKLETLVRSGISHGHFEITISGGDGKAGQTAVIIKAGKVFRFVVPKQ